MNGKAKRQGGISLIPSWWDELDRAAALAGVPRNQVMERAIEHFFTCPVNSQKISGPSHAAHTNGGAFDG